MGIFKKGKLDLWAKSFLLFSSLFISNVVAQGSPKFPDFTQLEKGEAYPGGKATSRKSTKSRNAFSHSSGNMGFAGELNFKIGNAMFRKLWVSSPASTKSSDGLGPLFNARSCQRCHLKDGRGHTPNANAPDDNAISMFLRLSIPPQTKFDRDQLASNKVNVIADPTYGTQLQDFAIQGHDIEGRMHITYGEKAVELKGGEKVSLRVPTYSVTDWGYGKPHPELMLSPRVAPQMIGLGLLEAIPEKDILAHADPEDKNKDGISGKPAKVWSIQLKKVALGRFGWKAGAPDVLQQNSEAFAGDIGIANPLVPHLAGECTKNQSTCLGAPHGGDKNGFEINKKLNDLVAFYTRNLAVPKRRNADNPEVLQGKKLFYETGCVGCHRPSYVTGDKSPGGKHLANQKIWPYTDLLLHDMGEGLADHRPEGVANGREWKTPPLWGIGLTRFVSGHTQLLHDGRARSVKEAILWHGGEAKKAREKFKNLEVAEREALIAFVNSL